MKKLPKLKELTIDNTRFRIGIDRANSSEYGGVKADLIPKDSEVNAIEVYIGRDGKLYIPVENIKPENEDIIITENSYLKFPAVGDEKHIYVDTTTNISYRFDTNTLKYYSISGVTEDNLNDYIQVINGNVRLKKNK